MIKNLANPFMTRLSRRGFTLVELLIVMVIIAVLLTVTTPFIISAVAATKLSSAGEQAQSFFSSAQQMASSEGRSVEIRMYSLPDESSPGAVSAVRLMGMFRRYEAGETNPDPNAPANARVLTAPIAVVVGNTFRLPDGVVIGKSTIASPLVFKTKITGGVGTSTTKILRGGKLEDYVPPITPEETSVVVFRPESTNLNTGEGWHITLTSESEAEKNPDTPGEWANFFCIQVDPVNGRVTSFRP